jgi:hypothetical protein
MLETTLHKQCFIFVPVKAMVKGLGKMEETAELPVEEGLHGMEKGYALVVGQEGNHFPIVSLTVAYGYSEGASDSIKSAINLIIPY